MKKILFLLFAAGIFIQTADAQPNTGYVDSTLHAYYKRCKKNIRETWVIQAADTLFRMSAEKNASTMQMMALMLKADHYSANNKIDSLKNWLPHIQHYAREHGYLKEYYHAWTRLISRYIINAQYTFAQYEIEKFMKQAEADNYLPAIAQAYSQLARIYRTKNLNKVAAEYYRKTTYFIEKYQLSENFSLANTYMRLAEVLIATEQYNYDEASDALEKAKQTSNLPEQIWLTKYYTIRLYLRKGEIQKANMLLDKIKQGCGKYLSKLKLLELESVVYIANQQYGKALEITKTLLEESVKRKLPETYYYETFRDLSVCYAGLGNYSAAYESALHYMQLYKQKSTDNTETTLNELATLLNVEQLNREKAELIQITQAARLHHTQLIVGGLSFILLAGVIFIVILVLMNRKLIRAKKATERANRMKSVFIQNVTHELNTPLNAIMGFAELISRESDPQEREAYVKIIQTNSDYLQKLVDDVLYISDIESSAQTPVLAPTDVNTCCLRSIHRISRMLPENVRFNFHPGEMQLTIDTSHIYVQQILANLLHNAAKFTTNGSIELAYTVAPDRKSIEFTVTDTGRGIAEEDRERIFDRFVKLNNFGLGTGLGLAVCRLAANSLNGEVRLDTSYTNGARFIFTLPIN